MPDTPSFAAAARARRPVFETPPATRRRPRLLLVGLPMFAVFAAFGAIVWLAYDHGADVPPVGEPPLIKAPTTALKLPPDEAGAPAVADQGEVRDLLTDTPPDDQLERLLPPPEEPMAPTVASPAPDTQTEGAPPPPPADTAAVDQTPPAQTAPPPAQPAPAPAQAATPPAQAKPPAPAPATPPQVAATTPAEPPRQAPIAVERQSPAQSEPNGVSSAPQPSPKEAEAALDALLAEVTKSAPPPSPPPAPNVVQPAPPAPVQPPAAVANLPRPAQPGPAPTTVSPFSQPGPEVTAIPRERPSARPSTSGASAAPTGPAPKGRVAAVDAGYRIQLAAVRDEADARRAWDLFLVDLGSVLSGVQPFIERADTANGVFYRVQVGPFASLQEAESLCDELKRRNASCFVIRR